ncbi:MAG: hypothetical protein WDA72_07905 [Desulfomonilia bacterium]|jgi:hypothetical protein
MSSRDDLSDGVKDLYSLNLDALLTFITLPGMLVTRSLKQQ